MTRYWPAYIILIALFFSACSKIETPSKKENFSFYGMLTDCVSGKALPGIHILAKGSALGIPGLFGPTTISYNLGETYTDYNGNFKLTPLKQNGIINYYLLLDAPYSNITFMPVITTDSIQRSSLTNYNMSFGINRYHYLKIYFSDSSLPLVSDTLLLNINCNGNNCGPGFNPFEVNSSPAALNPLSGMFAGNIRNGFAIFPILGNSITLVSYIKISKFFKDSQHDVNVYCNTSDTTYYKINY